MKNIKAKQLFNNRIFRTFVQTFISTLLVYFSSNEILNMDMSALVCILVSALATGLSAIMPLINIDNEEKEIEEEEEE